MEQVVTKTGLCCYKRTRLLFAFVICIIHFTNCFSQSYQWAFKAGASAFDVGKDIAVDGSGNLYAIGPFQNTVDFDPAGTTANLTSAGNMDIFVAKYTSAKVYQWAFKIGGTGTDYGAGIAADASGNVYITGYFSGTVNFNPAGTANLTSVGGYDIYVAKYNAAGVYQWAFNIGSANTDVGDEITVDGSGNVYVTGYFQDIANFDPSGTANLTSVMWSDIFVAKYNSSGVYQWSFNVGSGTGFCSGSDITSDASGNVYVRGFFDGTANFNPSGTANITSTGTDMFLAKYNTAGAYQWAFRLGENVGNGGWDEDIGLDGSGNVYVTGRISGTTNFNPSGTANLTSAGGYDIFLAKYDASGAYQWAFNIGSASDDEGRGIAIDALGNLYITGYFMGTVNFNPSGTANRTATGAADIFLAKYNSSGAYQWAFKVGGSGTESGYGIVLYGCDIYMSGGFSNTANFNPSGTANLSSSGSYDACLAKYTNPSVVVSVSGNTTVCSGNSATLTASGGINYSWSTGETTATISISPTTAASYTVIVSDAIGCTGTTIANIAVNPTPVALTGGNITICLGDVGTLNASGGTTYLWNTGGTTSVLNVSPTSFTTYSVIVSDGNCSDTADVSVTVNPLPLANAGTDITICAGSSATLNGSGNGSFVWSPSGGLNNTTIANPVASSTVTTTYTLAVSNSCGSITDDATITVSPLPFANAGPDISMCAGSSATLNGGGNGSFSWSPSTGLNSSTIANPVATPTSTITYTLTVTNSCGIATDIMRISTPASPSANAGNDVTICKGSSTTLLGSGAGSFVWANAATLSCTSCQNPIANPTSTTTYTLTITDICGSASDLVQITVNSISNITQTASICQGTNYILPSGTAVSVAGSYTSTLTSSITGCDSIITTTLTVNPLPNIAQAISICQGTNYTLPSGTAVSVAGSYTSTLTSSITGCDSIITTTLTVNPVPNITQSVSICTGSTYTLASGTVVSTAGTYTSTLTTTKGCDSVITTTLVVNPVPTIVQSVSICTGSSYLLPSGTVVNTAGSYTSTLTTTKGCDSIITTTVSVVSVLTSGQTVSICAGSTYILPSGMVVSTAGTYQDTLVSQAGCDSIITTALTIKPISTSTQAASICQNSGYTLPSGTIVSTAGTYTSTLTAVNGCDSIITTTLTIKPVFTTSQSASICAGSSYTLPSGSVVSTAGSYTSTLTGKNNCDSIITTVLTINQPPLALITPGILTIIQGSTAMLTASGGITYSWDSGETTQSISVSPVQSTTYCVTVTDANGCIARTCVVVTIEPIDCDNVGELYLPNAFSPNGEGENDELKIYYNIQCIIKFKLTIYDRWGEKVYQSADPNFKWDGSYKNKKTTEGTAVFAYYLDVTLVGGGQISRKGNISLIK